MYATFPKQFQGIHGTSGSRNGFSTCCLQPVKRIVVRPSGTTQEPLGKHRICLASLEEGLSTGSARRDVVDRVGYRQSLFNVVRHLKTSTFIHLGIER